MEEKTPYKAQMIFFGRTLLGVYFVIDGLYRLASFSASAEAIANHGFPISWLFVLVIAVSEIVCAMLMVIRYHTKIAASYLALFIIFEIIFSQLSPALSLDVKQVILYKDLLIFASLLVVFSHSRGYRSWLSFDARVGPSSERFELD